MKQCGYRCGLCSSPGVCELRPVGFGLVMPWRRLQTAARSCPYYVTVAGGGQLGFHLERRRRDWDVGNPYEKE